MTLETKKGGDGLQNTVLTALKAMRPPFALYEYDIHAMVGKCLSEAGISFVHEAKIGTGCRIDYLAEGVGIEIKKGKPLSQTLLRQLSRYAACDKIDSLVVVTQRSVKLPSQIQGKPLAYLCLSQLWGVALP